MGGILKHNTSSGLQMDGYKSGLSNDVEQRQSVAAPVDFIQMKTNIVRGKSSFSKSNL
jgi:hypothetical protein